MSLMWPSQLYADLVVSSISAEQDAASGRSLEVSWTVSNQGIGITNQNLWLDRIKLATDPQGQDIVATLTARGTSRFEHVGAFGSRAKLLPHSGSRLTQRIERHLLCGGVYLVKILP